MNSTIEILKPNFQEPKNISEIRKSGLTDNENSDNSSSDETPKKKFNKTSSFIKQNSNKSKKRVSFYTNKIYTKKKSIKKTKSKFYKNSISSISSISNSKLKSLEIFEQNFDLLIDEIEKDIKLRGRSKSTILTNNNEININENENEEKIISLTNMEIISNFYEYTENCMRLLTKMKPKENNKIKIIPRDFIFKNNLQRKKIAVFDLDETLIHCVGDIRTKKKRRI